MLLVITASSLSQTVDSEFLLCSTQKGCSSWVVWQEEPDKESRKQGYYTFDDEKPTEPFETCGSIDVADTVGNGATEGSCEVAKGDYESDADGAFVVQIPYRYEVYNS